MIIETKYNVNDSGYVMYDNKVTKTCIEGIVITIDKQPNIKIGYYITVPDKNLHAVNEKEIFKTKEELIQSL